jgi:GNAT superfamily N-acetyltransferase
VAIEPFNADDIPVFLHLAREEQWVAESWEFDFLLNVFPQGCFTARSDSGEQIGFVTALLHGDSGWIGNLVVNRLLRGKGVGEALFRRSMEALMVAGAETLWLTASKSGAPLYEKHGFVSIDTINRWVKPVHKLKQADFITLHSGHLTGVSHDLDTTVWGDRRKALLEVTAERGKVVQNDGGFIVLQPTADAIQLGPFAAANYKSAESLVELAIETVAGTGSKILVDSPESNQEAARLFSCLGMMVAGSSLLMYAGKKPDYRAENLYGLATMGSCG